MASGRDLKQLLADVLERNGSGLLSSDFRTRLLVVLEAAMHFRNADIRSL
jgi:hypothetical protein